MIQIREKLFQIILLSVTLIFSTLSINAQNLDTINAINHIQINRETDSETRRNVGDIPFDSITDNPDFYVKDEKNALAYNATCGMLIDGERYKVLQLFKENYIQEPINGETGYITIRFMVNSEGDSDRFRVYGMDKDYLARKFAPEITSKLLEITKKLKWKTQALSKVFINSDSHETYDYYQYLLFKINNGQIETILP